MSVQAKISREMILLMQPVYMIQGVWQQTASALVPARSPFTTYPTCACPEQKAKLLQEEAPKDFSLKQFHAEGFVSFAFFCILLHYVLQIPERDSEHVLKLVTVSHIYDVNALQQTIYFMYYLLPYMLEPYKLQHYTIHTLFLCSW